MSWKWSKEASSQVSFHVSSESFSAPLCFPHRNLSASWDFVVEIRKTSKWQELPAKRLDKHTFQGNIFFFTRWVSQSQKDIFFWGNLFYGVNSIFFIVIWKESDTVSHIMGFSFNALSCIANSIINEILHKTAGDTVQKCNSSSEKRVYYFVNMLAFNTLHKKMTWNTL